MKIPTPPATEFIDDYTPPEPTEFDMSGDAWAIRINEASDVTIGGISFDPHKIMSGMTIRRAEQYGWLTVEVRLVGMPIAWTDRNSGSRYAVGVDCNITTTPIGVEA